MAEVICIGMSCTDVALHGADLYKPPMEFVGRIPLRGISMAGGGDALNEAIVLGYMGHDVKLFVGRGDDGAGAIVKLVAEKAGVDISLSEVIPGYVTPVSVLLIDDDAERRLFAPVPGADGSFITRVRFIPDIEKIRDVKVVSLASLFNAPLDDVELVARIAKKAKAEGAIVCADTKPIRQELKLKDYKEALPYIDYIFPNEEEAVQYANGLQEPDAIAEYFLSFGVKNVLLKQGGQGVLFYGEQGKFHVPAFYVNPVDSTGCGDNFAAGFISGLLQGMDARGCCEFASAAASICVQTVGASTGVKSREQVRQRMEDGKAGRL